MPPTPPPPHPVSPVSFALPLSALYLLTHCLSSVLYSSHRPLFSVADVTQQPPKVSVSCRPKSSLALHSQPSPCLSLCCGISRWIVWLVCGIASAGCEMLRWFRPCKSVTLFSWFWTINKHAHMQKNLNLFFWWHKLSVLFEFFSVENF